MKDFINPVEKQIPTKFTSIDASPFEPCHFGGVQVRRRDLWLGGKTPAAR